MANSKKSGRLASIVRLAQLREQQSLVVLQQAVQHEKQQKDALQNIHNYRDDYYRQRDAEVGQHLPVNLLNNFTHFAQDLDKISAMQLEKVKDAQDRHQQAVDLWTEKYQRRRSLGELAQQAEVEERKISEKKLEREQEDNWVSRRLRRCDI